MAKRVAPAPDSRTPLRLEETGVTRFERRGGGFIAWITLPTGVETDRPMAGARTPTQARAILADFAQRDLSCWQVLDELERAAGIIAPAPPGALAWDLSNPMHAVEAVAFFRASAEVGRATAARMQARAAKAAAARAGRAKGTKEARDGRASIAAEVDKELLRDLRRWSDEGRSAAWMAARLARDGANEIRLPGGRVARVRIGRKRVARLLKQVKAARR